jgi:hypothetical protein
MDAYDRAPVRSAGTLAPPLLRCLVVANQTVGSALLVDAIVARATAGGVRFHLLVPATRVQEQERSLVGSEHLRAWPGEDLGFAIARYRLERTLRRLEHDRIDATGDVGAPDPLRAISEHLASSEVDEILLSTLPRRRSRWLQTELPRRVRRLTAVPVTVLESAR